MTDHFNIVKPTEGEVTLVLNWNDAEILTRALGMVNTDSLWEVSLDLYETVGKLVEVFGRNDGTEARRYVAEISGGQVYIYDMESVS